jgi:hypothetical protein
VNFATNAIASKIKHRLESKITSSVPPVPVAAPCSEQHPVKNPFTKLHGYSEVETEKRTNSQKLPLK